TESEKKNQEYLSNLWTGLRGGRTIAATQKQNLDILYKLLDDPDFKTGTAAGMQLGYRRALATLGIDPGAAAPNEVFAQTMARVLADQFSGLRSLSKE